MNLKNLQHKLSNNKNLILFYDYGSLNCALQLFKNFSFKQKNILFSQSKFDQKDVINIERNLNGKLEYNIYTFYFLALFGKSNLLILQSSKVRIIEKILSKFFNKYYVIQDYINDFKFGKNAIYISPFNYDKDTYLKFNIVTIKDMRPHINLNNPFKKLKASLLIIGAPNLIANNNNNFLKYVRSKLANILITYKPHPAENITSEQIYLFNQLKIKLDKNILLDDYIPRYIISPFSTLAYDLPEQIEINSEKLNIYHGFGNEYDTFYYQQDNFKLLTSKKSNNFFGKDIETFLRLLTSNNI